MVNSVSITIHITVILQREFEIEELINLSTVRICLQLWILLEFSIYIPIGQQNCLDYMAIVRSEEFRGLIV